MVSVTDSSIPIYGNYHAYYLKRPFVTEPRLALLPTSLFAGKRVLDVGCNEGWVTCEIAQSWGAHKVVGVDIDDTLVQAAWRRRRTVWSLQAPDHSSTTSVEDCGDTLRYSAKQKRESSNHTSHIARPYYFPASCEHTFGHLPIPPSQYRGTHLFPHNLSFRTANWIESEIPEDADRYDVVIAFSISKWIHINGGDDVLRTFFKKAYSVLNHGGTFVLEPQAWDTYAKLKRMNERFKENAKKLVLRPENFDTILQDIGFSPAQHLGTPGEGGFRRPVDLYVKA